MANQVDYLKSKIQEANSALTILLDNIGPLECREDLIESLQDVTFKANWLMSHFKRGESDE